MSDATEGTFEVEIRHNFETAHRLVGPGAPPKCVSIHGHSWWVTVTLRGPALDDRGMLVEFGAFKKAWRAYLDQSVDHHLVLRNDDPMADAVRSVHAESRLLLLPESPTTEVLARFLWERARDVLAEVAAQVPVSVARVHVQETSVNAATYRA